MRTPPLRLLACLPLLCLSAACGDGPVAPAAPRIVLVTCASDGPPPREGVTVERVTKAGLERPLPLRPVAGLPFEPPYTFEAPGAVEGQFHVKLPDGWGHLFLNTLPRLTPGGSPAKARVGKPHTFYVVSHVPRRLLGDTWGALRPRADGAPGEPVPLDVTQDPSGITILRIAAERWQGPLALMGRFVDGALTETWVGELKAHGRPIYFEFDPEPLAPLRIVLTSATPLDPAPEVEARVLGLPLPAAQRGVPKDGVLDLPGMTLGGAGVEVQVGAAEAGHVVTYPAGAFQATGELRVLAPPTTPAPGRVDLPGAPARAPRSVQARAAGATSYGTVPIRVDAGGGAYLTLDAGTWSLLLDDGEALQVQQVQVGGAGTPTRLAPVAPEPPAVVQGVVDGGVGQRVLWQREEDGALVLAQGFVLQTDSGGRYRGRLPPGTYQVVVEDRRGQRGAPRKVVLTSGMQLSLPL